MGDKDKRQMSEWYSTIRSAITGGGLRRKGFILILVVGGLAVLVILGLAFSEQGRVDLYGASNSRDYLAADGLGEAGFEIAKRILQEDRNVWSSSNGTWDTSQGPGWTSRWGYNPKFDKDITAGGLRVSDGVGANNNGAAFNRNDPKNYIESWQTMLWNDEIIGANEAFAYKFGFDFYRRFDEFPANPGFAKYGESDRWYQRHFQDPRMLLDNWQLEPLARVKKFKVNYGSTYGLIQIAISPRDGGINVNDVFDPGTVTEHEGWHDTNNPPVYTGTFAKGHDYASPDRRTLEYVLGKRPEIANRSSEYEQLGATMVPAPNIDALQFVGNSLAGQVYNDTGVYNYRAYFEPCGRSVDITKAPDYRPAWWGMQFHSRNQINPEKMMYFNASAVHGNRYNFEGARYPLFASTAPLSARHWLENTSAPQLYTSQASWGRNAWFPAGRYKCAAIYPPATGAAAGQRDALFYGFGFDKQNPKRAGIGAANSDIYVITAPDGLSAIGQTRYVGAGMYGHPRPRSFQFHFIPAVANGRFWTDLEANWYFGGAPGYTSCMAQTYVNNWAQLGSSYDSMGIGSNWMPPSTHIWLPGFWKQGQLDANEIARGLTKHPKNMPPAKPAATYVYPSPRWLDKREDTGMATPHFTFSNNRISIRASGIQENWGSAKNVSSQDAMDDNAGRFYDAININCTNFQVVYGLLTPEKIPSMMARTTVAPHLHWKARMLDAAYEGMETFARYDDTPGAVGGEAPVDAKDRWKEAFIPYMHDELVDPGRADSFHEFAVSKRIPHLKKNLFGIRKLPVNFPIYNPPPYTGAAGDLQIFETSDDLNTYMGPIEYEFSLHRQAPTNRNDGKTRFVDSSVNRAGTWKDIQTKWRVWGKMDFTTKEPLTYVAKDRTNWANEIIYRKGTGLPQDDVFVDTQHDLTLSPLTANPTDKLDGTGTGNLDSHMVAGADNFLNWSEWFLQRNTLIDPARADWSVVNARIQGFFPNDNLRYSAVYPEGINIGTKAGTVPKGYDAATKMRKHPVTGKSISLPHPVYGLPNPNYMQLYPGTDWNLDWAVQYRRYIPIQSANAPDGPRAPNTALKMIDGWVWDKLAGQVDDPLPPSPGAPAVSPVPASDPGWPEKYLIQPGCPCPKQLSNVDALGVPLTTPYPAVPAVNKDEGWRITRVGRKYQELIADEIMDYQINPWWPNPCQVFINAGSSNEMLVPLDREIVKSARRATLIAGATGTDLNWPSMKQAIVRGAPNLEYDIPDYYAYFNRFWNRAAHKYARTGSPQGHYAFPSSPGKLPANAVDGIGIYPKPYQYGGTFLNSTTPTKDEYRDRLQDFPVNTLEDQMGCEWRMLTDTALNMNEANMTRASARNHPFKNWADFVAFVGHMVYRAPFNGGEDRTLTNPAAYDSMQKRVRGNGPNPPVRDFLVGVNAYNVCHDPGNPNVDPRNKERFFDGSAIGGPGHDTADSLQGFYTYNAAADNIVSGVGGRAAKHTVVALDGYWPISANYGVYPGPYEVAPTKPEDMQYPDLPPGWDTSPTGRDEWKRRIDEWRGRDAAGLRVEHNYISEKAANDIIVSLSNGRVGPIDFDGNGHVEMTRKAELPYADIVQDATTGKDVPTPGKNKFWDNFPWNSYPNKDQTVEELVPDPAFPATIKDFTGAVGSDRLNYGMVINDATHKWIWQKVNRKDVIQDCVTLPIKFRSNTFRVTVVVELTDNRYRNVYATHRYSRVYSRVPGETGAIKVFGKYTGELIQHSTRSIGGVDPEMSWLGVE